MLDNCLIIDKDRWDALYQRKELYYTMMLFDFIIVKDQTTFRFLKNRSDGLTNLPIPNEYLPAIIAYYQSVTSNRT